MHKVRGAVRRLTWGLADQAVSSLTNFAVGIFVARSLSPAQFGIFSLAFVTYGVALNLSRGLTTDPLVVRYSGVATARWRDGVAKSSGTAVMVGVFAGACCAVVGLSLGGAMGAAFVALGAIMPGLLLQDAWRYAFFAAGQGRKSFTNDMVRAVALVPFMLLAIAHASVTLFVLAWGVSAAVAALAGCLQTRLVPGVTGVRSWLTRQRDLGPRYLIENVSLGGASQLRMYGVGAIAGLAAVGTVRGAELLLGPFLTVLMGVGLFAVPEAARMFRRSSRSLSLFCLILGGGQAFAALAWGLALLLLLPDAVGAELLGSVWQTASALILPATLSVMHASLSTGATAGLRALGAAKRSLGAQLFASAAYLTGGVGGAFLGGALGSSWGCAIATLLGAVVWWWQLRAGLRDVALARQSSLDGVADLDVTEGMRNS